MRLTLAAFLLSLFIANAFGSEVQTVAPLKNGRGLGDVLWTLDIGATTGDPRHMGVEFDGTNFWATGAYDFTTAYIYEISPNGVLVNKYPQPPGNWVFGDGGTSLSTASSSMPATTAARRASSRRYPRATASPRARTTDPFP